MRICASVPQVTGRGAVLPGSDVPGHEGRGALAIPTDGPIL